MTAQIDLDIAVKKSPEATTAAVRRRRRREEPAHERSLISFQDRKRPSVVWGLRISSALVVGGLVLACAGPLLWLFKAATSTSQETLSQPFALWPSGIHWDNIVEMWQRVDFSLYLTNTLWVVLGSWLLTLFVATTGGYGLSVLRPAYSKAITGALLATLFIPGVISLVATYLTVIELPLVGISLINTYWAVWLPAAASAFNVLLLKYFFDAIPRELYEAARIDGAGAIRVFWSVVLPMSRPILGVISLVTVIASYKEFLWPMLVLPDPDRVPISVVLPRLESSVEFSHFLAALLISTAIPLAFYLVFQRQVLRAVGSAGAIKG